MKPFFPLKKTYILEWSNPGDTRTCQTIVDIWLWKCPATIMDYWRKLHPHYNLHNLRRL